MVDAEGTAVVKCLDGGDRWAGLLCQVTKGETNCSW